MSEASGDGNVETELSRDMGLLPITFIGVGAMIGAGVFALTGQAAGLAGPALLVAFFLNGIVASFTAMSYAELGAAFPRSGGAYNWVTEALPRPWGFFTGWANWFAQAVACALYAVTFGVFFMAFLSIIVTGGATTEGAHFLGIAQHLWAKGLAAVVVALFGYINYRGAEETGTIGIVVTSAKIIILGLFVLFGALATFQNPNWTAKFIGEHGFFATGASGVMAAMGFTYVAFEGYDIIVQSGEEVIDPGTNIPKAIFYSIIVVIPIYILVAFAAIGGIDVTQHILELAGLSDPATPTYVILGNLGELGIIQAAGQFVPYGLPLLLLAGLAATMSALNATLYASSRIAFSMSRDKLLPDPLSTIHPATRSPHYAIAVSAVLIGVMAISLPINSVASSSSVMFLLLFSMVNVALIAMRANRPDLERPFEVPGFPYTPALGVIFQLILAPFLLQSLGLGFGEEGFISLVTLAIWFAIGIAVYYGYSEERERERMEEQAPTVLHERAPTEREEQILVPIANPEHADQFMRTAVDIAKERDAEILVMSVVTVPQQTPLDEGREFVDEKREVLREAMQVAEDADVPVNGTVRIGHDVAQAILNTIEQQGSDAVLVGWRGRSRRRDFVLGSNLDTIVTDADCDVLVEKVGPAADVEEIFLPTAGGPHADLAAEVARAIARSESAAVHVSHVVSPNADEAEREDAEARIADTMDVLDDVDAESRLVEGTDVADAIVAEAGEYDLTVIGATRESLLQQLTFGAIPEEVGRRVETTVIMTKRNLGITSRLQRWFSRT